MATGLGIDIGSESIKAVQVRISGGVITVTGALKLPRVQQVLDAPTEDDGQLVPDGLGEDLKRAHLRRYGVVGVTGREVNLRYLPLAPMPPAKMKLVIDMEIGGKLSAKKQATDAPAMTYDYRLLNTAAGLKGELVAMAGLCKEEYLLGVYASLKKAKLTAACLTPSCFGLVHAYLRTQKIPPNETVVLLDVGHELLEIAILEEHNLYFARSATGGGRKFTVGLDKILKAGLAKAAEFKHQRAKLFPEGAQIPSKQELAFQAALKEVADNIAGAIRSSLVFCRTQARLPKLDYQRIFISGGGARLNGLREYLEKKTGKPVQALDIAGGLDLRKLDAAGAKCFEGEMPGMAVALGLAVLDADPKSFHFKLLPEPIIKKRVFWRKTVFGFAAGVLLLAGLYWPVQNSYLAVDKAQSRVKEFEEQRAKAKKQRADFKDSVAENQAAALKVEYYARQTRMNRVYLDLFTCVRREMPKDVTLNYFGPDDGASGGSGPANWNAPEDGVRKFALKGAYDTETYPGTKFDDEEWEKLRNKLRAVPGVVDVDRGILTADEAKTQQGSTRFQLSISLQDPAKPLKAVVAQPSGNANLPIGGGNPEPKGP